MNAIIPQDVFSIDYSITWIYKDGRKVIKNGTDDYGILLIDEIPTTE